MLEKHPDGRYPCTLPGAKSHMTAAGQHGWRGAVRGLSLTFGRQGCGCGHVDRAGHSRGLGSNQEVAGPGELYSWTQRTSLWTAAQRPHRSVRICHSVEDAVQGSQPVAETGGQHVNLRHPPRHDTIPAHLPLPSPTQTDQSPYLKETGFSERKDVTQRRTRNTVRREFVRRVGAVTGKLNSLRIWVVARARL